MITTKNYSIKVKLVLLLGASAFVALLIAFISTLIYEYFDTKEKVINEHIKVAKVSGKNISASLTFLDKEATATILSPILNDPYVDSVNVYDEIGNLFVSLQKNKEVINIEEKIDITDIIIKESWDYIDVTIPIYHLSEHIGLLQIITTTDELKNKLVEQIYVYIVIMILTLLIVILIAILFESLFSKPIFDLLNAMVKLKESKDFDIRLTAYTNDEFSQLFNEFNHMANEIKERDKLLKGNNLSLKEQVKNTHKELVNTKTDLKKVSILATIDALTGLYNRHYIMEVFDEKIKESREMNKPLGVIILDIDHFKSVNDNLGHNAGDKVLVAVAEILKDSAREGDIVARIGGEEFLVLSTASDINTTYKIAERFRQEIAAEPIEYGGDSSIDITISLGVYSSVAKLNKEELMEIADEALYISKENGRNQTSVGEDKGIEKTIS